MSPEAPQEGPINGVAPEKHEWLTKVGLLVRNYMRSHRSIIDRRSRCIGHSLCTEAMLAQLDVRSQIHLIMDVGRIPSHFFNAVREPEGERPYVYPKTVLDSYPEGTLSTWTGNKTKVNVCDGQSRLGRQYPLGRLLLNGERRSICSQRDTYKGLVAQIMQAIEEDPPDLEELKATNPYQQAS